MQPRTETPPRTQSDGVIRNPGEAASEWRQGLSDEEREIVADTVAGTPAGAEFGF